MMMYKTLSTGYNPLNRMLSQTVSRTFFTQSRLIQANPQWMANPHPSLQAQTFYPMQCFYVRRQARINRRLRKYRAEKIEAESSFNKQEGKCVISSDFKLYSARLILHEDTKAYDGRRR